jgi:hypothetical protein
MFVEDCAAVRFDFAERDGAESNSLKSEREPSDSGEEIEDTHHQGGCETGSTCRDKHGAARTISWNPMPLRAT